MKRLSSSVSVLTVFYGVFFLLFSACMAEDATILP